MLSNKVRDQLRRAFKYGYFYYSDGNLLYVLFEPEHQTKADQWFAEHKQEIQQEIALRLDMPLYEYSDYSTGSYGFKKQGGVTLTFTEVSTGEDAYCIFNADIKYQRGPKKGKKLPKGKFSCPRDGKFSRFWSKTGLAKPRRLSEYHEHMGKLKGVIFCAEKSDTHDHRRLKKDSLTPLSMTAEDIRLLLGHIEFSDNHSSAISRQEIGNLSATFRQPSSARNTTKPTTDEFYSDLSPRAKTSAVISCPEVRIHGQENTSSEELDKWVNDNLQEHERLNNDTQPCLIPF